MGENPVVKEAQVEVSAAREKEENTIVAIVTVLLKTAMKMAKEMKLCPKSRVLMERLILAAIMLSKTMMMNLNLRKLKEMNQFKLIKELDKIQLGIWVM